MANRRPAPEAEQQAAPEVPAEAPQNLAVETLGFQIVDNTEAEAAPERVPEESERQLANGMTVVDYV